jgi:hypothetical protein
LAGFLNFRGKSNYSNNFAEKYFFLFGAAQEKNDFFLFGAGPGEK